VDIERYRSRERVKELADRIGEVCPSEDINIMEVCGTHTMAIARYGLRGLMPGGLRLISGPGCPVCVTPTSIINAAQNLSRIPGVVIATFGDMMRVPGTEKTLEERRAEGADVRVLYSVYDLLGMAEREREKNFIFISVGFETTTPGIALAVLETARRDLHNVFFLAANRLVIPALEALCGSGDVRVDGFLCPGHVSVIIGSDAYEPVAQQFHVPCVVGGFEPVDILKAIYRITLQVVGKVARVENAYTRAVTAEGNRKAREVVERVFEPVDAEWRGIGSISLSGLKLREQYAYLDALKKFDVELTHIPDPRGCRCGDVLRGLLIPPECPLFGSRCTPASPVGPCMVSSEGSCAAYYKYEMTGGETTGQEGAENA
jgi:hydrogenase expression/formation protein HypD